MPSVQKHFYVCFWVEGKNHLKPESTNPVLHEFYRQLNDFVIERGDLKVAVNRKDEALFERVNPSLVKGSIHLDLDVIKFSGMENAFFDVDAETESLILRSLLRIEVEEKRIRIKVMDATSSAQKEHPEYWPNDVKVVVSF